MKTLIVIPVRMASRRFPNKPMAMIKGKPMIQRVWEQAVSSAIGDVIVACSEKEVQDHITSLDGKAELTDPDLPSGTDRVYAAIQQHSNINQYDSIINLQGDMPNLDPDNIKNLDYLMRKYKYDIGTLASRFQNAEELQNRNIVKVETFEKLDYSNFLKTKYFFRKTINTNKENIYHHIGIYAFSKNALSRYVKLSRSKNEIERKLEQMRALDNNIEIRVALSKSFPLGIDTEEDFLLIKKSMEYKR